MARNHTHPLSFPSLTSEARGRFSPKFVRTLLHKSPLLRLSSQLSTHRQNGIVDALVSEMAITTHGPDTI
jgi:hypothetical protein